MPMATPSTGTPREDLLGAFSQVDLTMQGFIARQVLPTFTVSKRVGDFGVRPLKSWTQRRNTKRAPFGRTSRSNWSSESRSWSLQEYTHEQPIDRVNADLFGDWFEAEDEAAGMTRQVIELDLEADVAAKLFNQAEFPADDYYGADVINAWNGPNGTPLTDIVNGKSAMAQRSLVPDTLVITRQLALSLPLNPQIIDRIKYISTRVERPDFDAATLAMVLGVPRVLIANGHYDTSNASAASATLASVWSDNFAMLVCTSSERNFSGRPHLGRIFEQVNSAGVAMYSYEEEQTKSEIVGAEQHVDPNIIYKDAAYLMGDVYEAAA